MKTESVTSDVQSIGAGFAWHAAHAGRSWVINVAGYGAFTFEGTETEAEKMRAHKARWEGAAGHKRSASVTDYPYASDCWRHRGYVRVWLYGSRGRRLKKPRIPDFFCSCGGCTT